MTNHLVLDLADLEGQDLALFKLVVILVLVYCDI